MGLRRDDSNTDVESRRSKLSRSRGPEIQFEKSDSLEQASRYRDTLSIPQTRGESFRDLADFPPLSLALNP